MTMSFNLDRPILKELRVRQAVAHALDRQPFLTQILFGDGQGRGRAHLERDSLGPRGWPPMPKPDRAEAERLLDGVGVEERR